MAEDPKAIAVGEKEHMLPDFFENVQKHSPQGSGCLKVFIETSNGLPFFAWVENLKPKSWNFTSSKLSNSPIQSEKAGPFFKKKTQKIAEIPPFPPTLSC